MIVRVLRAFPCEKSVMALADIGLEPTNLFLPRWLYPFKEIPSGNGRQSPDGASDVAWDRNIENALTHEARQIAGKEHYPDGDRQALPERQA
jgi:hypothetical protein